MNMQLKWQIMLSAGIATILIGFQNCAPDQGGSAASESLSTAKVLVRTTIQLEKAMSERATAPNETLKFLRIAVESPGMENVVYDWDPVVNGADLPDTFELQVPRGQARQVTMLAVFDDSTDTVDPSYVGSTTVDLDDAVTEVVLNMYRQN